MEDEAENAAETPFERTRRIVVSDDLPLPSREILGRRLENPPADRTVSSPTSKSSHKSPLTRRSYFLIGACVLLIAVAVLVVKSITHRKVETTAKSEVVEPKVVADQSHESREIEDDAKQVIRRISRDNRPYSFNESSLRDIESRVQELSRSSYLINSLQQLQVKGDLIGSRAAKEGLQPGLVLLLGLALTKGGESGDSAQAAANAVPLLGSLSKTFGSNDADSCLILIAAFTEGPGTRRSHPLLRRINRVVTNPLTERNIWYLKDQNMLSANAYALAVDTIAFGVITRGPRRFGLEHEPLSF